MRAIREACKLKNNRMVWAIVAGLLVLMAVLYPIFKKEPLGQPVAGNTLTSRQVAAIPMDPWDADWVDATQLTLNLSAIDTPGATPRKVQVASLYDGQQIAFRLEWHDASKNVQSRRIQDFADAAAVQLAPEMINICMGQMDRVAHIWHWKADWQYGDRDLSAQFPNMHSDGWHSGAADELGTDLFVRPAATVGNPRAATAHESNVERLFAEGNGTLTPVGEANVSGVGAWHEGRWAVVFVRDLAGGNAPDIALAPGALLQAAFAVWDGAHMQRDGMKYTTLWATVEIGGPSTAALPPAAAVSAVALVPFGLGGLFWFSRSRRRQK